MRPSKREFGKREAWSGLSLRCVINSVETGRIPSPYRAARPEMPAGINEHLYLPTTDLSTPSPRTVPFSTPLPGSLATAPSPSRDGGSEPPPSRPAPFPAPLPQGVSRMGVGFCHSPARNMAHGGNENAAKVSSSGRELGWGMEVASGQHTHRSRVF